jgi:hypothetical protein
MSASKSRVLLPSVSVHAMLPPFSHYSFPSFEREVYRASIKLEIRSCNKDNEVKFLNNIILSHFDHIWSYRYKWQRHEVVEFYILLTVHLDVILVNDQLDTLFLNVFISGLYMYRATSAHHQDSQIVLIHHLV